MTFFYKTRASINILVIPLLLICSIMDRRVFAQSKNTTTNQSSASFSVVSVRPSNPNGQAVFDITANGIIERNNTLIWLIEAAFGLDEERMIVGAAPWIQEERFDVLAKVDESEIVSFSSLTRQQRSSMLQSVLRERFKLISHMENRDFDEFALIVGKKGPKLIPSHIPNDGTPARSWRISQHYQLDAQGITMPELCSTLLSTEARRLVVDRTGLTGPYDFTLRWRRENLEATPVADPNMDGAPNIFTAVQEELGLQLVSIRVPVKVLIIDHLSRPTDN